MASGMHLTLWSSYREIEANRLAYAGASFYTPK